MCYFPHMVKVLHTFSDLLSVGQELFKAQSLVSHSFVKGILAEFSH
jgi:hypothetical protein